MFFTSLFGIVSKLNINKHKGRYVEWFHQINQKNKKSKLIHSNNQKATKIITLISDWKWEMGNGGGGKKRTKPDRECKKNEKNRIVAPPDLVAPVRPMKWKKEEIQTDTK
ncbi:hypothetical protein ACFLZV_02575 [Candidatus Margulisiibacteriota bacterium]